MRLGLGEIVLRGHFWGWRDRGADGPFDASSSHGALALNHGAKGTEFEALR